MRSWTKRAVVEAIRSWCNQGRQLSEIAKQDQGLYCAGKHLYGSWREAVIAAGFEPTNKQWSKERVILEIRARQKNSAPLNIGVVQKEDPPLAGAVTRLFGNWSKALAAAGVSLQSIKTGGKRRTA